MSPVDVDGESNPGWPYIQGCFSCGRWLSWKYVSFARRCRLGASLEGFKRLRPSCSDDAGVVSGSIGSELIEFGVAVAC